MTATAVATVHTHTLLYGETPNGSLSLLIEGVGERALHAAHVRQLQAWMNEHDVPATWQAHTTAATRLPEAMTDMEARGCLR